MQALEENKQNLTHYDLLDELGYTDILIIDDDEDILNLITIGLKNYPKLNLLKAKNEEEAMKLSLKNSPDLIIADIHLPQVLGTKLTSAIHALQKKATPIIFISKDESFEKTIEHTWEEEAVTFLKKPLDLFELKKMILKHLSL